MINYIKGTLSEISEGFVVVEAAGVGYGIGVPATVLAELPPLGTEVKIYTYYSVKEDSQSLFGFLYKEDREIFKSLISISGLGPKGAISILSVLRPDDLRMAILTGDAKSISQAPGIGKRTAERIILELKDKIGSFAEDFVNGSAGGKLPAGGAAVGAGMSAGPIADAIEGLSSLGYSRIEAGRAVSSIQVTDDMTTEDVLKLALKNLSRG